MSFQDRLQEHVSHLLQEKLDEMKAMTPLPEPCTEGYEAWMAQHQEIVKQTRWATTIALLTLPKNIWDLVQNIRDRECELLNYLGKTSEHASSAETEKEV